VTAEQKVSKALIEQTGPVKLDLAYLVYLMEWANLNKN